MVSDHGVIYVATGERFIGCATRAAQSFKKFHQQIPILLYTDQIHLASSSIFDEVIKIEEPHRRSKVDYAWKTPFEKTLFLDADTRVCDSLEALFRLLDHYDIAMAHAQARNRPETNAVWRTEIPSAFPQFNSGVIAYRKNEATLELLKEWSTVYREAGFKKDQVTLRELVWLSDLKVATLAPEYNLRSAKYLFIWNREEAKIKIKHFPQYSYPSYFSMLTHTAVPKLKWNFSKLYVWLKHHVFKRS